MDPAAARPGFTLIELVIVLVVVGLLAVMAVPRFEVSRYKMDGGARGTVAALVAAQRMAVQRQHEVVVMFDTANRQLRIHQDRDNSGGVNGDEPTRMVAFDDGVVFGLGEAPAMWEDGSAITFSETQDGLPSLRFIRNGSASEEGGIYLTSIRSSRGQGHPEDTRVVRVDRATGRIMWYRYDPDASVWREGL